MTREAFIAICTLVCAEFASSILSYHEGAYNIGSLTGRFGRLGYPKASSDLSTRKYFSSHDFNSLHLPGADNVVDSHFKVKKSANIDQLDQSIDPLHRFRKDEPIKTNHILISKNLVEKPNINKELLMASAPVKQAAVIPTRASGADPRLDGAGAAGRISTMGEDADEGLKPYAVNTNRKRTAMSPQNSQIVYYSKSKTITQNDRHYSNNNIMVPGGEASEKVTEKSQYARHMHKTIHEYNRKPITGSITKMEIALRRQPAQEYEEEKTMMNSNYVNKNAAQSNIRSNSDTNEAAPKYRKLEPRMPAMENTVKDGMVVNDRVESYARSKKTANVVLPSRLGPAATDNSDKRYALFYRAHPVVNTHPDEDFFPIRGDSSRYEQVNAKGGQSKSEAIARDFGPVGPPLDSNNNYVKQNRGNIMTANYRKLL